MARALGVDYGEKRVGLAVSDPAGIVATPLRTASVDSDEDAVRAVAEACAETEAGLVVVGLPLNMDNTRGPAAEKVEAFAARLRNVVDVDVHLWDERLSTALVERALLEADMSRKKRRQKRDRLAAQVILQGYLDALESTRCSDTG